VTSYLPVTIDGTEIPADAPRSQGMDDAQAAAVVSTAEEYREAVMHLHADVADRTATITGSNCPPGVVVFTFGDGSYDVEQRVQDGATPTVEHTYASDGVFTAQLLHENGDRADLELLINWPEQQEAPA
jgi:hypothetical protein